MQYRSQTDIVKGSACGTVTDLQVGQLVKAGAQPAAKEAPLANARWQIARFKTDSVPGVLNLPVADLRRQHAGIHQHEGAIVPSCERVRISLADIERMNRDRLPVFGLPLT
ncbi:hypothetical protein [Sphingomonas qomolangmaensis]|uniref:Uncharacterized protein n=1 Tax=Sphingomonas qomolangmaensis TaxID=2918765 RepID=A0ABY5LBI0_9SPHN|nr:hypothetical protein [Sphingomonas qomolangmaensis]UUL84343.1 hypothetical protein NMP03_10435 [Sphingomonas qomolangmaensis]